MRSRAAITREATNHEWRVRARDTGGIQGKSSHSKLQHFLVQNTFVRACCRGIVGHAREAAVQRGRIRHARRAAVRAKKRK